MKLISFEALKGLAIRDGGITAAEVLTQRSRFGSNEIVEVAGNPWLELARDTLKDPMIWFLLGIGSVFLLVGNTSEAVILLVAILPLLFMDAILHWRTQASTTGLKGQLAARVSVLREGKELLLDAKDLVPGDLLLVQAGLFLPADGVFQLGSEIQVDESILTGEAFPVQKRALKSEPFSLADKGEVSIAPENLGYAGTRVLTGSGSLRVLFTGQRTAYGEIVQSVAKIPHERTPLQKSISALVRGLIYASAALCLLLAGVRIYQGHGWLDALLSAATLAVAAIPEEFPVVFTFFLGVGVYRLAKRRALVRRAVSVENIGRVTKICTDKTGTITVGILKLTHLVPVESIKEDDLLRAAFAASDRNGSDPVDLAIGIAAAERKLENLQRLCVFPFTEERKQETAFVKESEGRFFAYRKGAPETVLSKSNLSEASQTEWYLRVQKWAREGHKILACARRELSQEEVELKQEPEAGFEFCGLLAFEDPARPEVAHAMSYCEKNGIGVLMITGDHLDTAIAIARDVGLGGASPNAVSAEDDPEKFQEEWLDRNPEFLKRLQVVARCTPLQKLRIVNALKKSGELVAVTGDGVNDVPALKAADIGIAMGERGSRSAKEVSAIVLADDNFRTIVSAIMEGRQLFKNLRTSFKYLLLLHIPFVLIAAVIPLLGYPLLFLPVHIVWLELIIHPSALFAFQQLASQEDSKTKVQRSFFSGADIIQILVIGLAMTIMIGFGFISALGELADIAHARAKALAMLIAWSAGLVGCLSRLDSWVSRSVAAGTLISAIALIQIPALAKVLQLQPLHFPDWFTIIAVVLAFLFALIGSDYFLGKSERH